MTTTNLCYDNLNKCDKHNIYQQWKGIDHFERRTTFYQKTNEIKADKQQIRNNSYESYANSTDSEHHYPSNHHTTTGYTYNKSKCIDFSVPKILPSLFQFLMQLFIHTFFGMKAKYIVLFYCFLYLFCMTSSNTIPCIGDSACQGDKFTCNEGEQCNLLCNGTYSCRSVSFHCATNAICDITSIGVASLKGANLYCPVGDYPCLITNHGGSNSMNYVKIIGGGGDLIVYATEIIKGYVYCPENKDCNITAVGGKQTETIIDASKSARLNIVTNTNKNGWSRAAITCPSDGMIGNTGNCNFYSTSPNDGSALTNTFFDTVEGINDININCVAKCWTDGNEPIIACDAFPNAFCRAHEVNNEWQCIDTQNECNNFLLPSPDPTKEPSILPTMEPTTSTPTETPTKYEPFTSPNTVYVRNIMSCDYGSCSNLIGNHESYCIKTNISNILRNDEPPCLTMDYALNCLQGIGGNQINCTDFYDGYGTIDVGIGNFNLSRSIYIKYSHIVIDGMNEIQTN
eukprot:77792_1